MTPSADRDGGGRFGHVGAVRDAVAAVPLALVQRPVGVGQQVGGDWPVPGVQVAQPRLAVTGECCQRAWAMARRMRSAAASAPARSVSGSSTVNSSPPTRAPRSVGRRVRWTIVATATMTESPAGWPKLSL